MPESSTRPRPSSHHALACLCAGICLCLRVYVCVRMCTCACVRVCVCVHTKPAEDCRFASYGTGILGIPSCTSPPHFLCRFRSGAREPAPRTGGSSGAAEYSHPAPAPRGVAPQAGAVRCHCENTGQWLREAKSTPSFRACISFRSKVLCN